MIKYKIVYDCEDMLEAGEIREQIRIHTGIMFRIIAYNPDAIPV